MIPLKRLLIEKRFFALPLLLALVVNAFESVPDDAWTRQGFRGDGSTFTVDTLARYMGHYPVHHLADVKG